MADRFYARQVWAGTVLLGFAAIGLLASLFIPKVAVADPNVKSPGTPSVNWARASTRSAVTVPCCYRCSAVLTFILATLLQFNTVIYGTRLLGLSEGKAAMLLGILAVAVGLGSLVAEYLSNNTIEYGLVPIGTVGVTIAVASLAWTTLDARSLAIRLADSWIFRRPLHRSAGRVNAASPGPRSSWRSHRRHQSPRVLFCFCRSRALLRINADLPPRPARFSVVSGTTLAATSLRTEPPARVVHALLPVGDDALCLSHPRHRPDNIPERGPRIAGISNHMSFVDTLLLIASTDRVIRFVIFRDIYDHPFVKPIAKMMGAFLSRRSRARREVIQSLQQASDAPVKATSSASLPKDRSPVSDTSSPSAAGTSASPKVPLPP